MKRSSTSLHLDNLEHCQAETPPAPSSCKRRYRSDMCRLYDREDEAGLRKALSGLEIIPVSSAKSSTTAETPFEQESRDEYSQYYSFDFADLSSQDFEASYTCSEWLQNLRTDFRPISVARSGGGGCPGDESPLCVAACTLPQAALQMKGEKPVLR